MVRKKYLLGVSGGPDSMALLHYFYTQDEYFEVAHVNYQRRDTAARDQEIVERYCEERGIPCHIRFFPKKITIQNFQKDARDFRYQFFKEILKDRDLDVVVTAHHFDDDLETYLFQKRRKMLSEEMGIASWTEILNIPVWRPFLKHSKKELLDYCHEHNIPYGIDETNLELDYTRNKIRSEIHAMSEAEYKRLVKEFGQERERWQKMKERRRKIVKSWDFVVSFESYARIKDSERFLYLRDWLMVQGVDAHDFSRSYLLDLDAQIMGRKIHRRLGDFYLCYTYGEIAVYQPKSYVEYYDDLSALKKSKHPFVKAMLEQDIKLESKDFPVCIRNFQAGDWILKSYGRKRISRFFIDEKIALYKRDSWPVMLSASGEVIYVPGLGISVSFL